MSKSDRTTKNDLKQKRKGFLYRKNRPLPTSEDSQKKTNIVTNLKNFKKNWKKVKSSPYKSLVMQYKMTKGMAWLMGLIIGWRLVSMAISFADKGVMGIINGVVILIIGVWFVINLRKKVANLKKHMEYYEKNGPEMQGNYDTNVNVKTEIGDLLKKIKEKEALNDKLKEPIK